MKALRRKRLPQSSKTQAKDNRDMKDILIIAHFTVTPDEAGNDRFVYLAELLCQRGCHVEMVTTAFSHLHKAQRNVTEAQIAALPYQLTLLAEHGYEKNVSLGRLASHREFGRNLRRYLAMRRTPDLLYCGVPTPDSAKEAAAYARKHGIPFVIDVQDIWPDAFSLVFPIPILGDILFSPLRIQANRIYKAADRVVAVSRTYANRALQVNRKCTNPTVTYLGTDLAAFDRYAEQNRVAPHENVLWIGYVGTLGVSYDIRTVIDALAICRSQGVNDLHVCIMGDGPQRPAFEQYAREKQVDAEFTGLLPYPQMAGMLSACDIAVNPIVPGAAQSIINKVCDYAAAGLPVVNTQECPEYRQLVEEYRCGINCRCGSASDVADAILRLRADKALRTDAGRNARCMAERLFDRKSTYPEIVDMLLQSCGTACRLS